MFAGEYAADFGRGVASRQLCACGTDAVWMHPIWAAPRRHVVYVDAIMALVRLSDAGEEVVAALARTVLTLVEQLRDEGLRADMAEAALDAELGKINAVRRTLSDLADSNIEDLPIALRKVAVAVGFEA